MPSTTRSWGCSLVAVLATGWVTATSGALLRARNAATSVSNAETKLKITQGACQFVAHRPDDSEAVLTADGPQLLMHKGNIAVVESRPMRYLVSFAADGSCNEQAEQLCSSTAPANSPSNGTAVGCEESPCSPAGNGNSMLSYLRSMAGGALASRPAPSRSAVIGLGSGALASWLSQAFPDGNVDAVDLDPDVIAAARCFGLQSSSQLSIVESEGRRFLSDAQRFSYDAIFLDAFDAAGSLPPCLATAEFFAMVAQKLSPDQGVLSVNLGAKDDPAPVLAAIRKAFMHVAVGKAPLLTNHLVLASQTELTLPAGETSPAESLSPGSAAANMTSWARQAGYKLVPAQENGITDVPKTDAGEACKATES